MPDRQRPPERFLTRNRPGPDCEIEISALVPEGRDRQALIGWPNSFMKWLLSARVIEIFIEPFTAFPGSRFRKSKLGRNSTAKGAKVGNIKETLLSVANTNGRGCGSDSRWDHSIRLDICRSRWQTAAVDL